MYDVCMIGAGVVGLNIARELAAYFSASLRGYPAKTEAWPAVFGRLGLFLSEFGDPALTSGDDYGMLHKEGGARLCAPGD